jgi:hypothetical protein
MSSSDSSAGLYTFGWPSITNANPQAQTFMSLVAAVYKSGAPYLYDPDLSRLRDPDTWSKIMVDDDFRPAWQQRLAKVTRREWRIDPADDTEAAAKKSKIIDALMRGADGLYDARRHFAHAAMWGYAPVWTEGTRELAAPLGLIGEWWMPKVFRGLDYRQIVLRSEATRDPKDGTAHVVVVPLMATVEDGTFQPVNSPECLALYVWGNDTLDRKGYGRGLDEAIYVLVWVKAAARAIFLQGYEKWANGIVDVAMDASAHGTTDQDSASVADQHATAVNAMRALGYFIHDKRDEIKILASSGEGTRSGLDLLRYLGEAITRVTLNSVLSSGQASGSGSLARAGEEGQTTDDVMDAERDMIDDIVTRRIIGLIDKRNEPMWLALGLSGVAPGKFSSVADENEDPEKFGRVVELAQKAGLAISEDEAYRRFGLRKPGADEKVLEAPKPESPFGGLGGFPPPQFGDKPGAGGDGKPGEPTSDPRQDRAPAQPREAEQVPA